MEFTRIRHAYSEPSGFYIDHKDGSEEYVFFHFFNTVEIEYQGEIVELSPHSVVIYDKHASWSFKSKVPLTYDYIYFRGDINDILAENGLSLNTIYHPTKAEFVTKITYEMETEFCEVDTRSHKLLQYKFEELVVKLGRAVTKKDDAVITWEIEEQLRRLRGEVLVNLSDNWTIKRMADKMNYSESHFCTVYKSIYGITPIADLINARINLAKNMLDFSDAKVSDIASELGYWSTSHFVRQFKSRTGLSPNEYRKQNR